LGLEGTFKGHLVQLPCNKYGHLQLDQVAQSPVQPGLECFQGWGIYHLSGKLVPVFHHPTYQFLWWETTRDYFKPLNCFPEEWGMQGHMYTLQ